MIMNRTAFRLVCVGLVIGLCAPPALSQDTSLVADTVAHWTLDEAIDNAALDVSGNGHDAAIFGDGWQIVAGRIGGALQLSGSDYALATDFPVPESTVTVTAWVFANSKPGWGSMVKNWGSSETGQFHLGLDAGGNNLDVHVTQSGGATVNVNEGTAFPEGEWQHVAFVADGSAITLYRNAVEVGSLPYDGTLKTSHTGVGIGLKPNNEGTGPDGGIPAYWDGLIDDVWILSRGLIQEELQLIMEGQGAEPMPRAFGPTPKDGSLVGATWASLTWRAGAFAVSHDVYLGDNLDDVNDGTGDTFRGNLADPTLIVGFTGFPIPDGLVPGTTYYWRVDEVNDAEPDSPWKGDIWSFSIPPKTAYDPDPADGAEFVDPNAIFTWTGGFGANFHTVYIGNDFDEVNDAVDGAPQTDPTFAPGPLELEKVYYWRIDETEFPITHKGEIWSFTTPGAVGNPQPANGQADAQIISTLSWAAADSAASHELYFGTDTDAVWNATTASPEYVGPRALGAESYDPGGLAWDASYAWRVDEVYPSGTVKGLVWTFDTADFILVDDFESYDDIDPEPGEDGINRIFDKWIDGYGTTTNGALVGNDMPPYAETKVVHGGDQSMIYNYNNDLKTSEATLTLVYPRDWTEQGVTKLSLWFRGASANAADRVFIALNGAAAVYHENTSATQMSGWNRWVIDLQDFSGVDLTNVDTIAIGIGTKNSPAAGGQGSMYFDDLRLYR